MIDLFDIRNKLRYARMTSHWQDVDDVLKMLEGNELRMASLIKEDVKSCYNCGTHNCDGESCSMLYADNWVPKEKI